MMPPELMQYIRDARSCGLSEGDILTALSEAGWGETIMQSVMLGAFSVPVPRATVLEARAITKSYNGAGEITHALRDANLSIQKGESVAIVGKSGSGKSTLMHILATLDRQTSGDLLVDGISTMGLSSTQLDALRNKRFGFVFQQFFLNGRNTCLENVTLPLAIMGIPSAERDQRGMEILHDVGLADKAGMRAGVLSGGQKQRLCIARAMVTEPEVIFADEPTGNLDTENGRHVVELLFDLQHNRGITLVVVTHDNDLAVLCDRTITIRDGTITT